MSTPNPSVGCVIVSQGRVVGRGVTGAGGRPHGEAVALAQAGAAARGSTVYVTLEPCAHASSRGPTCADLLVAAGVDAVIIGLSDPDPRTNGAGINRLKAAGITVQLLPVTAQAVRSVAGFLSRIAKNRPHVTLKMATSLDGMIATANGKSRGQDECHSCWITGPYARAHGHLERARADMIIIGRGTYDADAPRLDVRLPGLEQRGPRRAILTRTVAPSGWETLADPADIKALQNVDHILVEGGAGAATSFMASGLVDRIILYRAPVFLGHGKACLGDIGLDNLGDAHEQWRLTDARQLGRDRLEIYEAA